MVTDATPLAEAEAATYPTRQRVRAILRPASVGQVQAVLALAQRHRAPIYAISGGKNWGYGSRVPVAQDSAILDLGRLNRIRAVDAKLAHARIEAGVTQLQLVSHLRRRRIPLWVDTTTSSPHASLLGNALDRGHGLTPYADHAAQLCDLEVVLPGGELLRTGFGRFPGARTAALDRLGLGPALDDLFGQSNLGVVTAATLWLMPTPEVTEGAFFTFAGDREFRRAIDVLCRLRLEGTLRPGLQLSNEYRGLQRQLAYPWERTAGKTPLSPAHARRIARERGLAPWSGIAGLYGTPRQVAAVRHRLRQQLGGLVSGLEFASEVTLRADGSPGAQARLRLLSFLSGGLDGPGLQRAYWRKRTRPEDPARMDLDRDRCGVIWCTPLVPFEGRAVLEVNRLARRTLLAHGFEPDLAMASIRDRVLHFHISIIYDRDEPGDDARALECQAELHDALARRGFWPHRLGLHSMALAQRGDPLYLQTVERLKRALDPRGVVAPGRYVR